MAALVLSCSRAWHVAIRPAPMQNGSDIMATQLITEIEIQASPARVWEILMDFEAYPTWNPFVQSIAGSKVVGGALAVKLQPPGGKPMAFAPKILDCNPNSSFRWRGKLWIRGLFDGEHSFELQPIAGVGTRFVHSEKFTGILVPLLRKMINTTTRQGFEAMNLALKARAEAASK